MLTLLLQVIEKENHYFVDLESLLIINVLNICDTSEITLNILRIPQELDNDYHFQIDLQNLNLKIPHKLITKDCLDEISLYCTWPVLLLGKTVISGLCSVCRQIIKSSKNAKMLELLGFREACLMACNESSIWTKFCEIDLPKTVYNTILSSKTTVDCNQSLLILPDDMIKFEYHMQQPVRMHNIYKIARETNNDKEIKSSVAIKDLNLQHTFAEGTLPTLSDILLYICFDILFRMLKTDLLMIDVLPLTLNWIDAVKLLNLSFVSYNFVKNNNSNSYADVKINELVLKQSLYTSDPNRYKPQNRIYTKQSDIDLVLEKITALKLDKVNLDNNPWGLEVAFNWETVPISANPEGGSLPQKRASRKCEQLENLAKSVIKLAGENSCKIVDFCSGSGHLGILLAHLLPNCEVILVENKERSLNRARDTITKLNYTNVTLLQCNLDYFRASFDIGVSLHACGVATDLVIQNCISNRAHFVCCPCCYGGIHDCYHVKYPRSFKFRDSSSLLSYRDYLNIAHAADQTHDKDNGKTKQGYKCMHIVDTDRKLWAEELGYQVFLGKLKPATCTPKNNLLVGIYKGR